MRVALVCDKFFYDSIRSVADIRLVYPDDDPAEIAAGVDLLIVVSTWRGCDGTSWFGSAVNGSPQRSAIFRLIDKCRAAGVPAVFFSKEDPPHYDLFKAYAKKCDFVFTTAVEMIDAYKRECGHDRVWVLPFCIDVSANNPVLPDAAVETDGRSVVFSGSWMKKYPARCRALEMLLDGVADAGFSMRIFNRNSWRSGREMARYEFPVRYRGCVRPAIDHDTLPSIYKRYSWTLNVNSVSSSETMFAMRVYESLACGAHVLSGYSYGMRRRFPMVDVAFTRKHACDILRKMPADALEFKKACGIREVVSNYANCKVMRTLFEKAGVDCGTEDGGVVAILDGPRSRSSFEAQTLSFSASVSRAGASAPGALAGFRYAVVFPDDASCSPFYAEDALNALKYSGVAFAAATEEESRFYSVAKKSAGDARHLAVDLSKTGLPAANGLPAGVDGIFLPGRLLRGSLYAIPAAARRGRRLTVSIDVGSDWKGLATATVPSLLMCKTVRSLDVVLENIDGGDKIVSAVVRSLVESGGVVRTGSVAPEAAAVRMKAGDVAIPSSFDAFVRRALSPFAARVDACDLLCGRQVNLRRNGTSVRLRDAGFSFSMSSPVVARMVDGEPGEGEPFGETYDPGRLSKTLVSLRFSGIFSTLGRMMSVGAHSKRSPAA